MKPLLSLHCWQHIDVILCQAGALRDLLAPSLVTGLLSTEEAASVANAMYSCGQCLGEGCCVHYTSNNENSPQCQAVVAVVRRPAAYATVCLLVCVESGICCVAVVVVCAVRQCCVTDQLKW